MCSGSVSRQQMPQLVTQMTEISLALDMQASHSIQQTCNRVQVHLKGRGGGGGRPAPQQQCHDAEWGRI